MIYWIRRTLIFGGTEKVTTVPFILFFLLKGYMVCVIRRIKKINKALKGIGVMLTPPLSYCVR